MNGKRGALAWALLIASAIVGARLAAEHGALRPAAALPPRLAAVTIDYPAEASIFPPEIAPPTFVWRDAAKSASVWHIEVAFADGSPGISVQTKGQRLSVEELDECCTAEASRLPRLTVEQAAAHSWAPDAATWAEIKKHSIERPAVLSITGFREENRQPVSAGRVRMATSKDPVGAPIFYRDVPLMPDDTEKGVIKPLVASALPLIGWRLRDVAKPRSRLLLTGLPTCANCHSFSADGKTLAMDLDGPENDKGLYALAPVAPRMSIRSEDVIEWNSFRDKAAQSRIGFMSQVSPDGQFVVTTVNRMDYVANFKDYRFLQVFYPTRGLLACYNLATREMHLLPGADDARYVHTGAVWTPDGKYLVFARAGAKDAYPEGRKLAQYANDPNETPIQYDLYRIPFNAGKGGRAEPIAGASANGMSNNFPKVSPDGRWIVFVRCRNGQLMRPDSQLYIVPAGGGRARRMRCNTPLMNSWHSFSPNGRWMVFSSKSRSPYTRMFLTHLDEHGVDSPAILIENSTAANRAVNIPEFVNIAADGLLSIDVPAAEVYRRFDRAMELTGRGEYAAAIAEWIRVLEMSPGDAKAHSNLGLALARSGRVDEALVHLEKALAINPRYAPGHNNIGLVLKSKGRLEEAVAHWRTAVQLSPGSAAARGNLGDGLYSQGRIAEALEQWRAALRLEPDRLPILNQTAWLLATCNQAGIRDGIQAADFAERAVRLSGGRDPAILDTLAAAYAETNRFAEAVEAAQRALTAATEQNNAPLIEAVRARIALYQAHMPFREKHRTAAIYQK